ncbi:hypothetical protein AX660_18990 [Paraglaciecola hydrolytica]|uniref:Porin domain-containing protein n=2 Tax=Paraglaciecola hydrolytica TaxID=1799789 RepID=A0A148KN28_9ALTE|nr:hypothetical protein AX660_18990 [Paraglaciecola hydrolytica]
MIVITGGLLLPVQAQVEYTGSAAIEQRYYLQDALYPQQTRDDLSGYYSPELYTSFNDGSDSLLFKGFYRFDQRDSERTHGDIRELLWSHVGDDWEVKTGIGKVFWGQTESLHLVDIINQTDAIESIDGEDKLGQPMVALSLYKSWGNFTAFVLPYFRERTFAGVDGRLRGPLPIDSDSALYESDDEEKNLDWALRWQHTLGDWEVGLSYFEGTSREPEYVPNLNTKGELVISPYYAQIEQFGVDVLTIVDAWIFKLEAIQRQSATQDYWAAVGGFEYTSVGVFDSVYDIGWLMEYQYDDREGLAASAAQNDLLLAARWALNDIDGTSVLFGVVQDLDYSGVRSALIEASSRINDHWKWRLDAYLFSSDEPAEPSYMLRRDDYVQFSLEYYF